MATKSKKDTKKSKKSKKSTKEHHSDRKGEYGAFADVMDAIYNSVQVKLLLFLYILFILVNTSEFIEKIMGQIPGALDGRQLSMKGIFLHGLILIIMLMIVDALISHDLL